METGAWVSSVSTGIGRCYFVYPRGINRDRTCSRMLASPRVIRGPLGRRLAGSRVDVADPGLILVDRKQHVFLHGLPVRLSSHGIFGYLFQVARAYHIVERLWRLLLVEGVL